MKTKKSASRFLALLLAVVMIFGLLPSRVNAASATTYTKTSSIEIGSSYIIVAQDGNNYYALANNSEQKIPVTVTGDTLALDTDLQSIVLWTAREATGNQANGSYNQKYAFSNYKTHLGRMSRQNSVVFDDASYDSRYFGHSFIDNTIGNYSSDDTFYGLCYGANYNNDNHVEFYYSSNPSQYNISFFTWQNSSLQLESIEISAVSDKTDYVAGENFDSTGMIVVAVYSDRSTRVVTDFTVTDGNMLTAGKTHVTVSYTEGGVTVTASIPITVVEDLPGTSEIHLGFTSDIHNHTNNLAAIRLADWLSAVHSKTGDTFDQLVFAGDNGSATLNGEEYWNTVAKVMDVVSTSGYVVAKEGFFVNGNHEFINGEQSSSNTNATARKIKNIGDKIVTDNYIVYGFGAADSNQRFKPEHITALDEYLGTVSPSMPVFVISHYPLHYFDSRTTTHAQLLLDVLNQYPNVIFLWGHNHTLSDTYYDTVYTHGSQLQLTESEADCVSINFTYAASGCMSDSDYGYGSGNVKGKGLVAKIDGRTVSLTYYNASADVIGTPVTVTIPSHEHTYSSTLSYDGTHHWYAATCGHDVTRGKEAHHGGDATCTAPAVCVDCGQAYGALAEHSYAKTWKYDTAQHWRECSCGARTATENHIFTDSSDSSCNTCDYVMDPPKHIHADNLTRIPGKDATCTATGTVPHYKCSCGSLFLDANATEEITDVTVPVTDHDWDEGKITQAPTPNAPGICTYTCRQCGKTTTEEIPFIQPEVSRLSGDNRVETAIAVADALKKTLNADAFDAIIIANGDNFADALAGSYLANAKNAPILLYGARTMAANETYIQKNLAKGGTIYILGGTAAIPASVEDNLVNAGYDVQRLYGNSRFDTNLAILEAAGIGNQEILICTGLDYADSLSASATGLPILMLNTHTDTLADNQIAFLKKYANNDFTIIGGSAAVSEALEAKVEAIVGTVDRIYGSSRETTSVEVAARYFSNPDRVLLAYSRNFPDGLCGGPLARSLNAPLLLVCARAETAAADYVEEHSITNGIVLGGTSAVSKDTVHIVFGMAE